MSKEKVKVMAKVIVESSTSRFAADQLDHISNAFAEAAGIYVSEEAIRVAADALGADFDSVLIEDLRRAWNIFLEGYCAGLQRTLMKLDHH